MSYLPIFLQLEGESCVVVGGGDVAARKVMRLLRAKARVTVVAPVLEDKLTSLRDQGQIQHSKARFRAQDLETARVVIAATNDADLNRQVSEIAQAKSIPVNVVDNPALCSFIMPSIIDRSPVQIAISTGGASPVLARLLRARLETMIPSSYGRLASLMAAIREKVKKKIPDTSQRRRFWERALGGPVTELLFAGREAAALECLERQLTAGTVEPENLGEVYLVGAGPGDADLLTFRALRLMQQADVVLYDRLVAPAIVDLARQDAKRIYVGKQRDQHTLPQADINEKLVQLAKEGKRVLRLKGGDPFIFGRGGEEIDTLSSQGIPFQIVPGITAASGCACYAGIPLTHRDYAQSCIFVTGHLEHGAINLNWDSLVQPQQTIAVYMGVHGIDKLCSELIDHGMQRTMPAALIQQGTTPSQRVFTGTLESLPRMITNRAIKPPTLIIIGEVVRLQEKLAWFAPGLIEETAGSHTQDVTASLQAGSLSSP